jgi:hypothetical protein
LHAKGWKRLDSAGATRLRLPEGFVLLKKFISRRPENIAFLR